MDEGDAGGGVTIRRPRLGFGQGEINRREKPAQQVDSKGLVIDLLDGAATGEWRCRWRARHGRDQLQSRGESLPPSRLTQLQHPGAQPPDEGDGDRPVVGGRIGTGHAVSLVAGPQGRASCPQPPVSRRLGPAR